jgi:hypothetical protein
MKANKQRRKESKETKKPARKERNCLRKKGSKETNKGGKENKDRKRKKDVNMEGKN